VKLGNQLRFTRKSDWQQARETCATQHGEREKCVISFETDHSDNQATKSFRCVLRFGSCVSNGPSHLTRNSSVSIATGYGLDGRDSIPGRGKRYVSTPPRLDRFRGSPSLLSNGYRGGGLSSRVKRTEREAGHSHPSYAEVKNFGTVPTLPCTS
jgi:hypothetical protein